MPTPRASRARAGPYGDGFGARAEGGLSLAALERAPHGVDLGPLQPRLPDTPSNNSWMHNLPVLVTGKARCTLHVHPDDAERYGLVDGYPAELSSRTGSVHAEVEITDEMMPGVVSLPHGWGHETHGTRQAVAAAQPGANSNLLADELLIDAVSGNAVLNGIPVQLSPVA